MKERFIKNRILRNSMKNKESKIMKPIRKINMPKPENELKEFEVNLCVFYKGESK